MDSDEIIEMDELVIVGSRYSKDLKDRLQPIYEAGEPMGAGVVVPVVCRQ